ncbi:MAG: hypothetical protein ACIAS6_01945 [Phycisphaerales bacterium JB060]
MARSAIRPRSAATILAALTMAGLAHGQQVLRTEASFASVEQSMWASGAGFVYDFNRDYVVSPSTGSLPINPGPVSASGVTVDTRFAVSAVADLGVGVGFGLDSGTVDASLRYAIDMVAPTTVLGGGFFELGFVASLSPESTLVTRSPDAYAHLDAIFAISNNLFAEAVVSCSAATALFGGIERGTFQHRSYPLIDLDLRETLFGFNPGGDGRFYWKGADVGGVGDIIEIGSPLAPAAEITVGDWRIDAVGAKSGEGRLTAFGQTQLISALIDIDSAITGGSPATGAGIRVTMSDNIVLDTGYDVIDFDTVYALGYSQAFELDASVLVTLDFSRSVDLRWPDGSITTATSVGPLPMDAVPQVRLSAGETSIRPTYTLVAELRNDTDLSFDVDFAAEVARGNFDFEFDSLIYDTTVHRSFGPLWSRNWPIANPTIDVYDQRFDLRGFDAVVGEAAVVRSVRNSFQRAQ